MNIVNAEHVSLAYGTRTLLDDVSLGLSAGEVVGVVGRNGDGKSTLLNLLVGALEPDAGAVVRASSASIGHLAQAEEFAPGAKAWRRAASAVSTASSASAPSPGASIPIGQPRRSASIARAAARASLKRRTRS